MATRAKKNFLAKRFAHAISVHYRDFEHAYVYWIWLRGSASYVIMYFLWLHGYILWVIQNANSQRNETKEHRSIPEKGDSNVVLD